MQSIHSGFGCFLLGLAPFFVGSAFVCSRTKRKSGWGICGSSFWVLVCVCFLVGSAFSGLLHVHGHSAMYFSSFYHFYCCQDRASGNIGRTRGKKNVICDVAVCSCCEQHNSREYLSGASNKPPGRHQIQNAEGPVLVPCAKQIYFRRDPKVDPLRIESGPSWQACFWSLHFVRCAEALQAAMCAKISSLKLPSHTASAAGILNWGGPYLRL